MCFSRTNLYLPCWEYKFYQKLTPLDIHSNLPWPPLEFSIFLHWHPWKSMLSPTFGLPSWNSNNFHSPSPGIFNWYFQQVFLKFFLEKPISQNYSFWHIYNERIFHKPGSTPTGKVAISSENSVTVLWPSFVTASRAIA